MRKTILIAALLGELTIASAQPAPGTAGMTEDQKKAEAKSQYEKGLSHYNLGEFDSAIQAFRRAYEISNAPGLLFNIAQAYRLKKDYEQASYFYTTYLRLKPDAPNRADVEERLAELEKLIADQKAMDKAKPIGTVSPDGKDPQVTVNVVDKREPTQAQPRVGGGGGGGGGGDSLMTAGLATAGAGGALVITGLVFGKMAKGAESDLNALNAMGGVWTQEAQDKYDAGKRNNMIATISFIAGGAAVATGGVLWVMGKIKTPRGSGVAVVPTRGGTTVAVGWQF